MALPRNEQDPQRLRSMLLYGNHHLENSFEDNGVGGQYGLDLLVLEDDVFQRYLSAQLDSQRFRGPTEASALTSCVILTLPPTCRPLARLTLCSCWT